MIAAVWSATLDGIDGHPVVVEVHASQGLPGYALVGLPDAAGRESRERVRAALLSSGFAWPTTRVTVNLAPATIRKCGAPYEAAIACGLLLAAGDLPDGVLDRTAIVGELGLDGSLRRVPGTLALVDALARTGAVDRVIVPVTAAREAALVRRVEVLAAASLAELHACLKGEWEWATPAGEADESPQCSEEPLDLSEVRGLGQARRALTACAAGGHNLLLVGPPGSGKTMLVRRLPTILPPLVHEQALAVTRIRSAAGDLASAGRLITAPPFRAPHHGASAPALVGGGSGGRIRIGEVTFATHGVLFLDELGEFSPTVLEALRQPIEDGVVRVARAGAAIELPADFVLVACSNPCPCGLGDRRCRCSDVHLARYRRRISAPLLDRFDLRLRVQSPRVDEGPGESSDTVRARVACAVDRQRHRYLGAPWSRNARVPPSVVDRVMPLSAAAAAELASVGTDRCLSGRGLARVRRVARTLADLDDVCDVEPGHVAVAAELRQEVL